MLDAKRADDDVGSFADRDAEFSQLSIVPRGARSQIGVQERRKGIARRRNRPAAEAENVVDICVVTLYTFVATNDNKDNIPYDAILPCRPNIPRCAA
jgi:hypothetical protein